MTMVTIMTLIDLINSTKMSIGKLPLSEAIFYLVPIANEYGLSLNRASDLKYARLIFANIYLQDFIE